ncbi:MAG: tetratricopeptide repeat protein [Leptospiraceae bacterium]|nr:tetratricopeptide repeat protein [Leptospiraceae bacterium]
MKLFYQLSVIIFIILHTITCASAGEKTFEGRGEVDSLKIRGFTQFKIFTARNLLGYIPADETSEVFDKKIWRGKVKEDSIKQNITLTYSTSNLAEVNPGLSEYLSLGAGIESVKELKLILQNPVQLVLEDLSIEPSFVKQKEFFNKEYIGSILKVEKIRIEFIDTSGKTLSAKASLEALGADVSVKLKREEKEDFLFFAENAFVGYKLLAPPVNPENYIVQDENKLRVVILPFESNTKDESDDKYKLGLAEATSFALGRMNNFLVIARNEYQKILEEQKLGENQSYDQKTAASIGKLMSANTLFIGKISRDGNNLRISSKLIDVETGALISKSTLKYDTKSDNKTISQIADEWEELVVSFFGDTKTIAKLNPENVIGTRNEVAWEFYARGREKFLEMSEETIGEAIELFSKAIQEDTNFAESYAMLAEAEMRLYFMKQFFDPRKEEFEKAKKKILENASKSLVLKPDLLQGRKVISLYYEYFENDIEESIFHAQYAVDKNPKDAEAKLRLFRSSNRANWSSIKTDNLELKAIYELNPSNFLSNITLGEIARNRNEIPLAINYFKKAVKISPKNNEASFFLAQLYLMQADFTKALSVLKRLEKKNPDSPSVSLNYGLYYKVKKEYDKSITYLLKASKEAEKSDKPWQLLGSIYLEQKKYKDAVAAFQKCIEKNPDNVENYRSLGDAHLELDEFDLAIKAYEKIVDKYQHPEEIRANIAEVYIDKKDYENARTIFTELANGRRLEDQITGLRGLANVSRREKKYEVALEGYKLVFGLSPDDPESLLYASICEQKLGKLEDAANSLKKLISKEPNNGRAYFELSKVYLTSNPKESKQAKSKACSLGYKKACGKVKTSEG